MTQDQIFWLGFLLGGIFACIVTVTTSTVRALWSRKRRRMS